MTGGRIDASILRQLLIALAMIGIMLSAPARPVALARARQGRADPGPR
jgi:branched-chain amino acid transport system permease protein